MAKGSYGRWGEPIMMGCGCGGAGCKMCKSKEAPKLFIPTEPMGAVRTTQKQKFSDPRYQKYAAYKQHIALLVGSRVRMIPPGAAIIITDLTFYMPKPKSGKVSRINYTTGKRIQVEASEGMPRIAKPDIDNLIKGLFDALNGVAWSDDNQVYRITNAQKIYSEYPGIEFGIEIVD